MVGSATRLAVSSSHEALSAGRKGSPVPARGPPRPRSLLFTLEVEEDALAPFLRGEFRGPVLGEVRVAHADRQRVAGKLVDPGLRLALAASVGKLLDSLGSVH